MYVLGLFWLNIWAFPFGYFFTDADVQLWPHNSPLWYVQGLLFCWLTYPLLRNYMCGPKWTRHDTLLFIIGLGLGGVLPVSLLIWAINDPMLWLIVQVFPVFLLPVFYLGAAACDLYLQELRFAEENSEDMVPSTWSKIKQDWAGLFGEIKLVLFIVVQFEQYPQTEVHSWSLLFGSMLYLMSIAASQSSAHAYTLGIRWLLGSKWLVVIGDASLCAFTFQEPIAIMYYWATRPGAFGTHMGQHWMPPWEFALFLCLLYSISIPFGTYFRNLLLLWVQAIVFFMCLSCCNAAGRIQYFGLFRVICTSCVYVLKFLSVHTQCFSVHLSSRARSAGVYGTPLGLD